MTNMTFFKPTVQDDNINGHHAAAFIGLGKPGGFSPQPVIMRPSRGLQNSLSRMMVLSWKEVRDSTDLDVTLCTICTTTLATMKPRDEELFEEAGPALVIGHEMVAYVNHTGRGRLENNNEEDFPAVVEHVYKLPSKARSVVRLKRAIGPEPFYMMCVGMTVNDESGLAMPAGFDVNGPLGNVYNLDKGRRAIDVGVVQFHCAETSCRVNDDEKGPRMHYHFCLADEAAHTCEPEESPIQDLGSAGLGALLTALASSRARR